MGKVFVGLDWAERVLIPLEGTAHSTDAVAAELQALSRAGVGITVLHVFRPGTDGVLS